MSVRRLAEVQPASFAFTAESQAKADWWIAKYPAERKQSASIPLLWLVQKQEGWVSEPAIRHVAGMLDMPVIRVLEVATFYTMFNLVPVGRFHVQVCGTTPCMLRGSDDVLAACKNRGLSKGHTTADGLFTLTEVECLGACANAPMVQINDDNYEDLTFDTTTAILEALAKGEQPKIGPQIDRKTSCPEGGPTTLVEMVSENHDYRGSWVAAS
jgi:NADH-quinone oxidoreductase subunit E